MEEEISRWASYIATHLRLPSAVSLPFDVRRIEIGVNATNSRWIIPFFALPLAVYLLRGQLFRRRNIVTRRSPNIPRDITSRLHPFSERVTHSHHLPGSLLLASTKDMDAPRQSFFALIIGIDTYRSPRIPDLKGAVADARAVHDFLSTCPSFQPSIINIKYLENENATRAAILHELESLRSDARIQRGDPIMIYYAGHGSSAVAPRQWIGSFSDGENHKIQLIVPHDCGEFVAGIPDRTIAGCLDRLAEAKGDNITVVFDCCHSGSGTRDSDYSKKSTTRARYVDLPTTFISPDLDSDLWETVSSYKTEAEGEEGMSRAEKLAPKFAHRALRSHMLLAACGMEESALEVDGRGVFTSALLKTLEEVMAEKVSYEELMMRMPDLLGQNPQCEGVNRTRRLFTTDTAPSRLSNALGESLSIVVRSPNLQIDVGAAAAGPAAEFPAREWDESLICLCIELGPGLDEIFDRLEGAFGSDGLHTRRSALQHPDKLKPADANLRISLDGRTVVFDELTDAGLDARPKGFQRLPFTAEPSFESIYPIITAATHWYYHLRRKPARSVISLPGQVTVEFLELVESGKWDSSLMMTLVPTGSNLIVDDVIDFIVNDEKIFGQNINNLSSYALYPSLFYFDNSDFSITSYYLPPISTLGGKPDPPLPPGSFLPIGYGSGGALPRQYFLRDGQDIDIGYLKLYLTTKYVDLSSIVQDTPFTGSRHLGNKGGRAKMLPKHPWDEITVMIVQRRYDSR